MFEQTPQKTHVWLNDVTDELGIEDKHTAYTSIRVSLHARDRLTLEEAVDLGAQLPMLLRGLYYDGWKPSGKPLKYRDKEEFLQRVEKDLRDPAIEPESAVRAVFAVLSKRVTRGEIDDVKGSLPPDIRELWQQGPTCAIQEESRDADNEAKTRSIR